MIEIAIAVTCYGNENEIIEFAHKLSNQKESEKMAIEEIRGKKNYKIPRSRQIFEG